MDLAAADRIDGEHATHIPPPTNSYITVHIRKRMGTLSPLYKSTSIKCTLHMYVFSYCVRVTFVDCDIKNTQQHERCPAGGFGLPVVGP